MQITILATYFATIITTIAAALPAFPTDVGFASAVINTTTAAFSADTHTDANDTHPAKRDLYAYRQVRVCEHINGGGRCVTQRFRHGLCYNVEPWWDGRISSVYPEAHTRCRMHRDRDCRGGNKSVGPNGGIADLRTIGWNDVTSSMDCFAQG